MALRKQQKALELIWRGSASWGPASDLFTHNYYTGNYVSLGLSKYILGYVFVRLYCAKVWRLFTCVRQHQACMLWTQHWKLCEPIRLCVCLLLLCQGLAFVYVCTSTHQACMPGTQHTLHGITYDKGKLRERYCAEVCDSGFGLSICL